MAIYLMSTLVVIDISDKKGRGGPSGSGFKGLPHVETFCPDLAEGHGGEACQLARKLDGSRGGYFAAVRASGSDYGTACGGA